MPELLGANSIERLGRALFAALAPATGSRAGGTITATNPGAEDVVVPPNTYMLPVVGGQLRHDLLFKTKRNDDQPRGVATAGDWLVDAAGTGEIEITSNVGGARHNLPEGTVFRFDPLVPGLAPTATLTEAATGGSNTGALIRRVALFEELDASAPGKDVFAALLDEFPAAMLIWTQSEPAEGALAGLAQGRNRAARKVRFFRESFVIHVIAGRLGGDAVRRQEGIVVVQAICRLLSDRMQNDDGEQLSTVGAGVEITNRARIGRTERHYIYGIRLRVNQTFEPLADGRSFAPWERTRIRGSLPGREAPEPTTPLDIVDDTTPMP